MADPTLIAEAQHAVDLRLRRLAADKSHLELILHLVNKIGVASDLDSFAALLGANFMNVIGGISFTLFYTFEGETLVIDDQGRKSLFSPDANGDVVGVMQSRLPNEIPGDFADTQMTSPAFTRAYTWVVPLIAGEDLVGAMRIGNLHVSMADLGPHLQTLFTYIALGLRSALHSSELQLTNERLERNRTEIASLLNQSQEARRSLITILEEQRLTEAELRTSEDRFQTMFQAGPMPLALERESDGVVLDVNLSFCAMTGYGRDEIIGRTTTGIGLIPSAAPLQGGTVRLCTAAGEDRSVHVSTSRVEFGRQHCRLSAYLDITERVRAGERMGELAAIVEASEDAIYRISPEGRIQSWNEGARRMYGYTEREIVGEMLTCLASPDKQAEVLDIVDRIRAGESVEHFDTVRRTKLGEQLHISLTGSPIRDAAGTVVAAALVARNITRQKIQETLLQAREQEYRTLAEHSPDVILRLNTNLIITYGNPASERAFGRQFRAGASLLEMNEWYADVPLARFIEHIHRVVDTGTTDGLVISWTNAGQTRSVRALTIVPEHDTDGTITGALAIGRDVTALTRAEESLRASERFYREVFDGVSDGILVYDVVAGRGFRCVNINSVAARVLGRTNTELQGRFLEDVSRPGTLGGVRPRMEACASSGTRVTFELEYLTRSGELSYYETTMLPVLDADGAVARIIIVAHDINERRKAERDIRKMMRAIEQSPASIVITDARGSIEYVNPSFTRVSGYAAEEALGRNPRILRSGEHPPEFYRTMWETISRGEEWRGEILNRRKNGELYWEAVSISPIKDGAGATINFLAVKEDITEQKALHEQLIRSQRMEGLGTLAAGIAHDFNNILGIILGHANIMEDGELSPMQAQSSVRSIESAASRGALLVRHLLMFAQKTDVRFEPVHVAQVLAEVLRLVNETFPRSIAVENSLLADLPPIHADATQVHQVLLNLAVNARDAMPRGGTLAISAGTATRAQVRESFPAAADETYVCVTVRDTGTGMGEEVRTRIFEPFFTTKGPGKGTGLGLSIVFGVMETHKGFVGVASAPGQGTTFSLYFPAVDMHASPAAADEQSKPLPAPGGGETILVVEDEELLREMVTAMLGARGYTVVTAKDGIEALTCFTEKRSSIDLVLTDMGLPRLEGAELVKRLIEIDPNVKVIIASGYLEPEVKAETLRAGARECLQKPYSQNELLAKVRTVLDASPA
jgi:two-component system, cell cycle sensor histidine kinase and response regulator CckA